MSCGSPSSVSSPVSRSDEALATNRLARDFSSQETHSAANPWIPRFESERDKQVTTWITEKREATLPTDARIAAQPGDVGVSSPKEGPRSHTFPRTHTASLSPAAPCPGPRASPLPSPVPSMYNGTRTTVPQSMIPRDLPYSHNPQTRRFRPRIRQFSVQSREHFELKCCRIHVLLVVMEFCLGVVVTALAFYMQTITPTLRVWECPYWAGIPLVVAGVLGIYYLATDFAAYSATAKAFLVKTLCVLFSMSCIFICMVAAAFTGIHGNRIAAYHRCDLNVSRCECAETSDPQSRVRHYDALSHCDTVFTSVKDYLILQCALNAIASGVCMWFVTLLWRAKYQGFHSGLQFHSYSAS